MNDHLTKFQRRQDLHKSLFWWVLSKKDSFKAASDEECIKTFYKRFKIDDSQFPIETAKSIYQRMKKEFLEEEDKLKTQFSNYGKKQGDDTE